MILINVKPIVYVIVENISRLLVVQILWSKIESCDQLRRSSHLVSKELSKNLNINALTCVFWTEVLHIVSLKISIKCVDKPSTTTKHKDRFLWSTLDSRYFQMLYATLHLIGDPFLHFFQASIVMNQIYWPNQEMTCIESAAAWKRSCGACRKCLNWI